MSLRLLHRGPLTNAATQPLRLAKYFHHITGDRISVQPQPHYICYPRTTINATSSRRNFSFSSFFTAVSNSAPVYHFQEHLVLLHDVTGLPWWATVVVSTVALRTVITLPLAIYSNRVSAKLENITGEMPAIVQELKKEAAMAHKKFKWSEQQTRIVYNRSVQKQWTQLIERDNCHPLKTMIVLWGQIPLWIIQSAALRNLLAMMPNPNALKAKIIFTELSIGGFGFIPNLTEVDASYILPITLGLLNLAIIEIQLMSRVAPRTKFQTYATNFFRIFSVVMIPIAASVPAAISLYWTVSSAYGLGQNLLLLSPRMRRLTGIPITGSQLATPYAHLTDATIARLQVLQTKVHSRLVPK